MDASGRVRVGGALDEVFGLESSTVFSGGVNRVSPTTATEWPAGGRRDRAAYTHPFGRGQAVYLNASLLDYFVDRTTPGAGEFLRDLMGGVLARCGVEPVIKVESLDGTIPVGVEVVRWSNGRQNYLALFRNPRTRESGEGGALSIDNSCFEQALPIRVTLPSGLQVYDMRERIDLGVVEGFETVLDPWRPKIYTLAPGPLGRFEVASSGSAVTAGESVRFSILLGGDDDPTDTTVNVVNRQVFGPDGTVRTEYRQNLGFVGRTAAQGLYFALNDPPGAYRVVFTHVPTGREEIVSIDVR